MTRVCARPAGRRSASWPQWASALTVLALTLLATLLSGPQACAELVPSPELSFRAVLARDSITVGDPIPLRLTASAPVGATLILPTLADSLESFVVLEADPPVQATKDGRIEVSREARVTLFRAGPDTLPALALLWARGEGDTLVAWSRPVPVQVGSVLQGTIDLANLKDLKKPVRLERALWWVWALLAAGTALAAWWLARWYRRRRRQAVSRAASIPAPALPPEIAFEQGLAALRAARLPEQGRVREYYFELSLLFRRYLEDRFDFPAVEETRLEILARASLIADLAPEDREYLAQWLSEGDLVKFAKPERLLAEAEAAAEGALAWVRRTAARRLAEPSAGEVVPQ